MSTEKTMWVLLSNCEEDRALALLVSDRKLTNEELMATKMLDFEDEAAESGEDAYMLMDLAFHDLDLEWQEVKVIS